MLFAVGSLLFGAVLLLPERTEETRTEAMASSSDAVSL